MCFLPFPTVIYANALQCARMVSANESEAGVLGLAVQGQIFPMCSVLGTQLECGLATCLPGQCQRTVSCLWLLQQMCRR